MGEKTMNLEFYGLTKKLREYRLDSKVTLKEIEEKTGISQQRMKRIEQGVSPITVEEVETLLAFYQMDANAILAYNDLARPAGRSQKALRAVIWIALLAALSYGGYKGYAALQGENTTQPADGNVSIEEIMKKQPEGGEQKVSEFLTVAQADKPPVPKQTAASEQKKEAAKQDGFRLAVYGDRPYHTGGITSLTQADFQLFPVSQFQVGQGVPEWIKKVSEKAPTGLDVANVDILKGQSRIGIAKEIELLNKHHVRVLGYGSAEQVFRPQIFEKNGVKYGLMSYTRVVPAVEWKAEGKQVGVADAYGKHIFDDIRRAKQQVDVLILTMYWGKEGQTSPEQYQKDLAYNLLDAGVDMVVGHRSSIRQSYELYNGKYIFYNLGPSQLDVLFDGKNIKEIAIVQNSERSVLPRESQKK